MSLHVPCEYASSSGHAATIKVEVCEGVVYVDVTSAVETEELASMSLTTYEARALATALLHHAAEIEAGRG